MESIQIKLDNRPLIVAKNAEQARKDYIAYNIEKSMEELTTAKSWLTDLDYTSFHLCTALAHIIQANIGNLSAEAHT